MYRWQANRFAGDEQIFAVICGNNEICRDMETGEVVRNKHGEPCRNTSWMTRNSHLSRYYMGIRDNFGLRRRHLYRDFVAMLAKDYGRIIVEKLNLRPSA